MKPQYLEYVQYKRYESEQSDPVDSTYQTDTITPLIKAD